MTYAVITSDINVIASFIFPHGLNMKAYSKCLQEVVLL